MTDSFTSILFSAVFALFLLTTDKVLWLSEWNPHIIMFPMMLFALAMAALGSREVKYLYLGVFAGSFVAQTHIGGIPALFVSFLIALLSAVYPWIISSGSKAFKRGYLKHLLISLVLLLVLWAPPIYEEITADTQGNMSKIREFFEETEADQDIESAFEPWINIMSSFELNRIYTFVKENGHFNSVSNIIVALRLLLLVMGFSFLRRKGKFNFLCSLNLICIFLHFITYYSVVQIRGELNSYLIEWMKIIAPLSLFSIFATFFVLIGDGKKANVAKKYSKWIFALFILYSSISLPIKVSGYFGSNSDQLPYTETVTQELSVSIKNIMDQQPENYFVLKLESRECWALMFGIMNNLEKQGYLIFLEDNMWFTSILPSDNATVRILHLGTLTGMGENNPALIARYDNIGIILQ